MHFHTPFGFFFLWDLIKLLLFQSTEEKFKLKRGLRILAVLTVPVLPHSAHIHLIAPFLSHSLHGAIWNSGVSSFHFNFPKSSGLKLSSGFLQLH